MKIEKIRLNQIKYLIRKHCKYETFYFAIKNMPLETALKITLDKPLKWFPTSVYQNFRKERTGYSLHIYRQDQTNKIFAIIKTKKDK